MRAMDHPDRMEFYTSRRASNESAFLYQAARPCIWHQQFPGLLEHVPRSDQRRPAAIHWRRQRHGDALRISTMPTRSSASATIPAPTIRACSARCARSRAGARRSSWSIRCVNGARTLPGPAGAGRDGDFFGDAAGQRPIISIRVGGDAAMFKGMMKALFAAGCDESGYGRGRVARPHLHRPSTQPASTRSRRTSKARTGPRSRRARG